MTPPRTIDATAGGSVGTDAEYDAIVAELAKTQGVINVAEARKVELVARAIEIGVSGGTNLPPSKWLAWLAGVAPGRAHDIVRLASRRDELPHTMAALSAGELSVDQAAEIARFVPARFERSAAQVAQCCTVAQLKKALPHYRDPKPERAKPTPGSEAEINDRGYVSTGYDERGYHASIRLPEAQGAIFDQALKAMQEDLRRKAKAEAPEGTEPEPVRATDALVALAETALRAGEAARPGTDRYLVHAHLEAGPNGIELMNHLGVVIPDGQRRHILCDAKLRGLVHEGVTPVGTGRATRTINRRLRRAVEHRDGGCCTIPGCGRTTGLEIHHIWHWEDGGPTETWNLVTLCRYHHACHHQGTLGIEGNADLPRHRAPGLVFTDRWGRALDSTGRPIVPHPRSTDASSSERVAAAAASIGVAPHVYVPPTGERMDSWGFHLQEDRPAPDPAPDEEATEPPPQISGRRPATAPRSPAGPAGDAPVDPTRAGPHPA